MGVWDTIRSTVDHFMARDKDQAVIRAAQGAAIPTLPGTPADILAGYGYDYLSDYLRVEQDMLSRFVEYESMDDYPLTSTALNIYADEVVPPDTPSNRTVWIESPDRDVQDLGNDLLHKTLRIEDTEWNDSRSLVKYGNEYQEILVGVDGVLGLNNLPPHTCRRIEGLRGELYGFVQDFRGRLSYSPQEFVQIMKERRQMDTVEVSSVTPSKTTIDQGVNLLGKRGLDQLQAIPFEPWQVSHLRLRTKYPRSVYGMSILEPVRWIFKRLIILEDAALLYRLQRTPERFAYYIPTGSRPQNEAKLIMLEARNEMKKKKYVNPVTGELDLRYSIIAQDEDVFIPVPEGGESAKVELLGGPNWQRMDDIEYFLQHMFTGLLIPRAYMSEAENISRPVLSSQDVRFARTILRIQRERKQGTEKIVRVHLAALGIPPDQVEFAARYPVSSAVFELAQIEVRNARAQLMLQMKEHVSMPWILREIMGLSDDEIKQIFKEREEDAEREGRKAGRMEKAQMSSSGGAEGGGGAPSFGGSRRPIRSDVRSDFDRDMQDGSKPSSKVMDHLNSIMNTNSRFSRQLRQVQGLMNEIRSLIPPSKH